MRRVSCLCSFLILIVLSSVLFSTCTHSENNTNTNSTEAKALQWIREKSTCIGASVDGETVQLTYSLHFKNSTDRDILICYPQAKFNYFELYGWMEYEKNFSGYGVEGENTFFIQAGEEKDIIIIFEGTYTGGAIKENLSLPTVAYLQKTCEQDDDLILE